MDADIFQIHYVYSLFYMSSICRNKKTYNMVWHILA